MSAFLTIVILALAVLLILVVLIQNPKGGGINQDFAGSVELGGVRRSTEVVEKITWALFAAIVILCIAKVPMDAPEKGSNKQEINLEQQAQ